MPEIKLPEPFVPQKNIYGDELEEKEFFEVMSDYKNSTKTNEKEKLESVKRFIRTHRPQYTWGGVVERLEPYWAFLFTIFLIGVAVLGICIGGFGMVSFIRFIF